MDLKIIEKSNASDLPKNKIEFSSQRPMLVDATLLYSINGSTRRGRNMPANGPIHGNSFEDITKVEIN